MFSVDFYAKMFQATARDSLNWCQTEFSKSKKKAKNELASLITVIKRTPFLEKIIFSEMNMGD